MSLNDIYTGWKNFITGKETPDEKKRKEICKTCMYREKRKTNNWCTQCPCYMPAKVKAPKAKCPKRKW